MFCQPALSPRGPLSNHSAASLARRSPLSAHGSRTHSLDLMKSMLTRIHIHHLVRELAKALVVVGLLAAGTGAVLAQTGASVPPPVISIAAMDPAVAPVATVPVFTWRTDGRPLEFTASASRADNSPVDVYFGVLVADGRAFSWIGGTATIPILLPGLSPLAQGITHTVISTTELLGRNPQHIFAADDPPGLYSVFFFLVPTGANPADSRQWIGASMSPLVLSN